MVTFREAAAGAIRGALCSIIAVNDDAVKLFGRVVPPLAGAADYANFFAPLRQTVCNQDPSGYIPPNPGIVSGGQCPGVNYDVTIRSRGSDGAELAPIVRFGDPGPVSLSRAAPTVNCEGAPPGRVAQPEYTYSRAGIPTLSFGNFCGPSDPLISIVAVRSDGLPDECGDQIDPDFDPTPGPIVRPINFDFDIDVGGSINVDGDITFSPTFSVGPNTLFAPFTLNLGGIEFSGNLQIAPRLDLNIGPNISFGGGTTVTAPLPPTGDPGTPADPENDDPNLVIIGVVVRSTQLDEIRETEIETQGMPTIVAPRIASVSFAIESSFTIAWTPDQPVKNRDCYVPCPAVEGAVAVAVSPQPGWSVSWVAVRGLPANST